MRFIFITVTLLFFVSCAVPEEAASQNSVDEGVALDPVVKAAQEEENFPDDAEVVDIEDFRVNGEEVDSQGEDSTELSDTDKDEVEITVSLPSEVSSAPVQSVEGSYKLFSILDSISLKVWVNGVYYDMEINTETQTASATVSLRKGDNYILIYFENADEAAGTKSYRSIVVKIHRLDTVDEDTTEDPDSVEVPTPTEEELLYGSVDFPLTLSLDSKQSGRTLPSKKSFYYKIAISDPEIMITMPTIVSGGTGLAVSLFDNNTFSGTSKLTYNTGADAQSAKWTTGLLSSEITMVIVNNSTTAATFDVLVESLYGAESNPTTLLYNVDYKGMTMPASGKMYAVVEITSTNTGLKFNNIVNSHLFELGANLYDGTDLQQQPLLTVNDNDEGEGDGFTSSFTQNSAALMLFNTGTIVAEFDFVVFNADDSVFGTLESPVYIALNTAKTIHFPSGKTGYFYFYLNVTYPLVGAKFPVGTLYTVWPEFLVTVYNNNTFDGSVLYSQTNHEYYNGPQSSYWEDETGASEYRSFTVKNNSNEVITLDVQYLEELLQ